MSADPLQYAQAVRDFRAARQKAGLQELLARLRGEPTGLLSFEQVRSQLRATGETPRGLVDVPLDSIVGSVGRYTDFTRDFLPLEGTSEGRWARVKSMMEGLSGLPPIEVYKVGDAYFVKDGHHRVSVAREMGVESMEAYVTEINVKVPLDSDVKAPDLIIKAEQVAFLNETRLDLSWSGNGIKLTEPGKYETLLEHIQVHRYYMGLEEQHEIGLPQAAAHWHEHVYQPVVEIIRREGILRDFPGRTEADLYIWLSDHKSELESALGFDVDPGQAAADLAGARSSQPDRVVGRVGDRLRSALIPDELESGPAAGDWRRERLERRDEPCLFRDLLVPIVGDKGGWEALEQAVEIGVRESGRLLGLHVTGPESAKADMERMARRFLERCEQAGVGGSFTSEPGKVAERIAARARWADLVVLKLEHPPVPKGAEKLSSGLRTLIRRCPRPLLMVPGTHRSVNSALLAYDEGPKAQEALFVGTYMAAAWGTRLTILTVEEEGLDAEKILERAQEYLRSNGATAEFLTAPGPVSRAVLANAHSSDADLILIGGYGATPVMEVVLGSAVDYVLRKSDLPILICR